jgi:hypothetical protein
MATWRAHLALASHIQQSTGVRRASNTSIRRWLRTF